MIILMKVHDSSKEQHLFEMYLNFCNIINVFTVTFDQYKSSLVNKSINFFKKCNKGM